MLTCGIWRPIKLIACDIIRLNDVCISQKHLKDGSVTLDITAELTAKPDSKIKSISVIASLENKKIAESKVTVRDNKVQTTLAIQNPELWWPNGMGKQPLYTVTVNLLDKDGKILNTVIKRIGLRTLHLQRKKDKWGESFQFVVNGVPFFAKGACWIPADTFAPHLKHGDYTNLIKSATEAHMNMLRVWGAVSMKLICFMTFAMNWVFASGRISCSPALLIPLSTALLWKISVPNLMTISAVCAIIPALPSGVEITKWSKDGWVMNGMTAR